MPSTSQWLAFVFTSIAILVVPGPSVLFVVTRGISYGRRAALSTMVGNESALLVHAVAVALGVGTIVQRSVLVFNALKLAGAVYLVYLGVSAIRHRRDLATAIVARTEISGRRLWRDGFLVGLTNPKSTLVFLAILPQFVTPENGHPSLQLLVLGLTFVVLAVVNDGLYGMAAGSVRGWLGRSPRRPRAIGAGSGLVMIGLGVRLAVTGRE